MGAGKNPYLRYRIIHSCLSQTQKKFWSIQELIARLQEHDLIVDKRSIERDLETMRHDERLGYLAPIAYHRKEKGYHYTNPNFSIDQLPLTNEDLEALALATNILHQYKSSKVIQHFDGLVDKLGKVVSHLTQPHHKLIAFEHQPYYKGREFFDDVLQAITEKRAVRITYHKFESSEPHVHTLHPYFLKEYRGRWYALGYSEQRHYTLTLALDRILKVEVANVAFKENKHLKPKQYFEHTLGITLGKGPVEEIELRFSKTIAPYIKTQHLHHSQKTIAEDENGLTISLRLIPNPELRQVILGYGADVKVLKPDLLREEIQLVWEKACGNNR